MNQVILGDCLEELPKIPDKSVDMILTDLPYGVTNRNKWDVVIPIEPLFKELKRVCSGVIVMTATNPFASELIYHNRDTFKYEWIWQKEKGTGFLNAKKQPLRDHELILVFYNKQIKYNPQLIKREKTVRHRMASGSSNYGVVKSNNEKIKSFTNCDYIYPKTTIKYARDNGNNGDHPTQKPIALFEYLIKTYTNESDLVLDCCAGSGTTAIACLNTNRKYICIEKEQKYYDIINDRIKDHNAQTKLKT